MDRRDFLKGAGSSGTAALLGAGATSLQATPAGAAPAGIGAAEVLATGSTHARTLANRLADVVDVLDFGADPSGASDSTPAFGAAARACVLKGGGEVRIPAGTFKLGDLRSPSGVRWVGQGPGRTRLSRLAASPREVFIVRFDGSVGTGAPIQEDAAAGSYAVAVGGGALPAVGSWVLLREATYVRPPVGRKQQILRVVAISGRRLSFAQPLLEDYTRGASAEICALSPVVDAGMYDLALEGVNAPGSGGIVRAQFAVGLELEGTVAQYFSSVAGYSLSTCLDSHLRNVTARDGLGMSTIGHGYGAELDEACTLCSIEDSTFENVREVMFTNRTSWSRFSRNRCIGNQDSGFNTHGALVTHVDVEGNQILGVRNGTGIAVGYGTHSAGDRDVAIRNNTIQFASAYGIAVTAPPGKENERIEIEGNKVIAAGARFGVAATHTGFFRSRGNCVDFLGARGNTGYYLIGIQQGQLVDDWVRNVSGAYGFRVDSCRDVDLVDCRTDGLDAPAYQLDGKNAGVRIRNSAVTRQAP